MFGPGASTEALTRGITGFIPLFLIAATAYSTWVTYSRMLFGYWHKQGWYTSSYVLAPVDAIFLLLMGSCYMRTYLKIQTNPGVVPLPPLRVNQPANREQDPARPFDPTASSQRPDGTIEEPAVQTNVVSEMRYDDPALETFFSMDAFVCDGQGHPLFCYYCKAWKPDRAHHSSESGRCFRKMDHYCPWVGGMVAETSFKFFVQFNIYASAFCALNFIISVITVAHQKWSSYPEGVDVFACVVIGLSTFFLLFTGAMSGTAMRYVFGNTTNIDSMYHLERRYRLAIRIPGPNARAGMREGDDFSLGMGSFAGLVVYPLHKDAFMPGLPPRDNEEEEEERDVEAQEQPEQGGDEGRREQEEERERQLALAATRSSAGRSAAGTSHKRYYAIVMGRPGENPWDRGWRENFRSVMGNGPVDWFLPIRMSPCVAEFSNEGFYRFGPLIETLRARHRLGHMDETNEKAPLL